MQHKTYKIFDTINLSRINYLTGKHMLK